MNIFSAFSTIYIEFEFCSVPVSRVPSTWMSTLSCAVRRSARAPLNRSLALRRWAGAVADRGVRKSSSVVAYSKEVALALEARDPVVALESTIISHGMPYPQNLETAREVESIVRENGATPATIAILDGSLHVGLEDVDLKRLAIEGQNAIKCSRRDLSMVLSQGAVGATTVSGTMIASELAGIEVFVTGGIGGVHRGVEETMDVSADLSELGRTPVAVVCAGVKSILDIPRTLEYLETQGVAVMGWNTDSFPAFFTVDSGEKAPMRVNDAEEVASWLRVNRDLGMRSGAIVAVPNPEPADQAVVDSALGEALKEVREQDIAGKEATPFLLRRLNELTGGESLRSNIALVKNNAIVGSRIAVARAALERVGQTRRYSQSACSMWASSDAYSSTSKPRPVIFGGATADIISSSVAEVTPGTSNIGRVEHSHGGAGRNLSECMGRVWHTCSPENGPIFSSVVGDDDTGRAICQALLDIGVDTSHTRKLSGQRTAIYNAVLNMDGDLVAAIADMEILEHIDEAMVQGVLDKIDKPAMIIVDGNLPVSALSYICSRWRDCRDFEVPIWFEPTSVAKSLRVCSDQVLSCVQLVSPNLDELFSIASELGFEDFVKPGIDDGSTSNENIQELASQVAEYMSQLAIDTGVPHESSSRHVLVTLGANGAILVSAKNGQRLPSASIAPPGGAIESMQNCTGAGDCLLGTTAACVLRWPGMRLEDAVLAGMEAAKCTIKSSSAVSPCLDKEWLQSVVKSSQE